MKGHLKQKDQYVQMHRDKELHNIFKKLLNNSITVINKL